MLRSARSVELRLTRGKILGHGDLDFVLRRQPTVTHVHSPERVTTQRVENDFEQFGLDLVFPILEPGVIILIALVLVRKPSFQTEPKAKLFLFVDHSFSFPCVAGPRATIY